MDITFLCHNHYSLLLSYIYTRNIRSNLRDVKINLILNSCLQAQLKDLNGIWDFVFVHRYIKFAGKNLFLRWRTLLQFYVERYRFRKKIKSNGSRFLFVFKDTGLMNCEMIRLFRNRFHSEIILIEEGFALYSDGQPLNSPGIMLKRLIGTLLFLPAPHHGIQGLNEYIQTLLLKKEALLPDRKRVGKRLIRQSEDLFSTSIGRAYIRDVHGMDDFPALEKLHSADILFIGQPLSDQGKLSGELEQEVLQQVFKGLTGYKVMIKPHPLEDIAKYDKALSLCPGAFIIDRQFRNIPAEVIYCLSQAPVAITPWSSASVNIRMINPDVFTFYLYKLFHYPLSPAILKLVNWYDGEKYQAVDSSNQISAEISGHLGRFPVPDKIVEPTQLYPEMQAILSGGLL